MNLLLLEAAELDADGILRLADRRAEHLLAVLKVEVGQAVRVGVLGGRSGRAEVVAVESGRVDVAVPSELLESGPALRACEVDVILALPRPQALHRVLQTTAAMGVRRLYLVRSWRVEKSFFGSPSLSPESIRKHLWLGAEQGMVTRLPEVRIHRILRPFWEQLEVTEGQEALRLVAHPEASRTIDQVVGEGTPTGPGLEVAIGPEGGWIDREVERFMELGFHDVRLGPWILKVENALTALLAQLDMVLPSSTSAVAPPK